MELLLVSFVVGFTIAVIPGPVQTLVLQSAILGKYRKVTWFALGAVVMDGLYLFFAYLGVIQFISGVYYLNLLVMLLGFGYMLYLGIVGTRDGIWGEVERNVDLSGRTFWAGLLMVAANPQTIIYFIGVSGVILVNVNSVLVAALASFVLFIGSLVGYVATIVVGSLVGWLSNAKLVRWFYVLTSIGLIVFSVKMLLENLG